MSRNSAIDSYETLKLTEWELGNLHLPPVTTVTLYEGKAPVEFLRGRIKKMLEKKRWLTSRLIKKNSADGVVTMTYTNDFDAEIVVEQHFSVYKPCDVALTLIAPYEEFVERLLPVQCARSKPAIDEDEALFKVAVVPIEMELGDAHQSLPLQKAVTLPGFALVVSMNHTLGDGHTYYKLYSMLGIDSEVEELEPVRVAGFEEAKTEIIGKKESAMLGSASLGFGILGTYLGTRLGRKGPQNVSVNEVNPSWIDKEKVSAKKEARVPFVSSNDVLTSWFFRQMGSDVNIMVANFRSRQPSVLNLSDRHVGNYESNLPYFPVDIEAPALIRQSIRDADGAFRAMRAVSPVTRYRAHGDFCATGPPSLQTGQASIVT